MRPASQPLRGDSHVIDLGGSCVVPLGEGPEAHWPPQAALEVGGRADLAVLQSDPRRIDAPAGQGFAALAVVRGGRVVAGSLPGSGAGAGHDAAPRAGS
jgi:hypothetical protein